MDKTHHEIRETHDFMSVDSFSQLPFIRPAPAAAIREKGIRLFGIEFGNGGDHNVTTTTTTHEESDLQSGTAGTNVSDHAKDNNNNNENNADSSRKFECHYCCRNFPTSQALGGHQNAHKRERQHAKRAHLQSTMAHNSIPDGHHLYGLVNYRLGPVSPTPTSPTLTYPSWNYSTTTTTTNNNNNNSTNRFYGFSHQRPINGSPLALWRIPAVQNNNNNQQSFNGTGDHRSMLNHPLPLFAGDDLKSVQINGSGSQNLHVYESKPNVQDHVSLDLHL